MSLPPPAMTPMPGAIRADLFAANIQRLPTAATFRGTPLTVRISEPSLKRQLELEGARQQTVNLEAMMRLPAGSAKPEAEKEHLIIAGVSYRIVLVQLDFGPDCYICSLTQHNR